MKKMLCFTLCLLTLVSCDMQRGKKLENENASLTAKLEQKNKELENAMSVISEVQEGFRAINQAEKRVIVTTQGVESESEAEKLRSDIVFIQKKMEENRQQIDLLQQKLKKSGAETGNLKKILNNLRNELDDKSKQITALHNELAKKNIRIAELDSAIVMLTGDVNNLQRSAEAQQEVIDKQETIINRAWYVYGTSKELKEQNIVKKGEVLVSSDFNQDYFTPIDIRVDKAFPLYAKRAQLLTSHPEGSYEFTKDEKKELTLHILNTESFWSISRYMVIQIK